MTHIIGSLKVAGGLAVSGLCLYFLLRADKQARRQIESWKQQGNITDSEYDDAVRKMTIRMRAGYGFLMVLALVLTAIYMIQFMTAF